MQIFNLPQGVQRIKNKLMIFKWGLDSGEKISWLFLNLQFLTMRCQPYYSWPEGERVKIQAFLSSVLGINRYYPYRMIFFGLQSIILLLITMRMSLSSSFHSFSFLFSCCTKYMLIYRIFSATAHKTFQTLLCNRTVLFLLHRPIMYKC